MKRLVPFVGILAALALAGWSWGGGGILVAGQFWGSRLARLVSDIGPIWP